MRPVTILIAGLVASGTTATLVFRAVQKRVVVQNAPTPATTNVAVRPVVVAAHDVAFGAKLGDADLKTVDWPVTALPQNAFDAIDKVTDRVALARLVANEPLTNEKLAPAGHGLLSLVIDPGMRGVTVRVNEVAAVGGFISPGSRVDVLVTAESPKPAMVVVPGGTPVPGAGASERYTRTVLQNVAVLALGQHFESSEQTKPNEASSLTTATLLVTPEQGELLALGSAEGTLQLVLRNFEDNTIVWSPPKTASDLFERSSGAGSALVAGPKIEVIRGADRQSVTF